VYARVVPQLAESVVIRPPHHDYTAALRAGGGFDDFRERRYAWQRDYSTDEWLRLIGTHSDHLRLDPDLRAHLFAAVAAEIDAHGGELRQHGSTYALLARRRGARVAG
jgi:hypothetical protein